MKNNKKFSPAILKILQCPNCRSSLIEKKQLLYCQKCKKDFQIFDGKYIFTEFPKDINPSEIRERGSNKDTNWRKENTKFLDIHMKKQDPGSLILDVGAGRGDFLQYYKNFPHYLLDVYPYPEIDIVCDLTKSNPFQPESIDAILLMNVLEHVYNPSDLLRSLNTILKSDGRIFITIPFFLKIHQAPLDFQRLTHYAIKVLAHETGFTIEHIDGVYDPSGLIHETIRYFRFWTFPEQKRLPRIISKIILSILTCLINLLGFLSQRVHLRQPFDSDHPAPLGYQVIFKKT
jgi:SAM-dependent methyltransferase